MFLDRSKGNASLVDVIDGTLFSISSIYVRDVTWLIKLFWNIIIIVVALTTVTLKIKKVWGIFARNLIIQIFGSY